MFEPVEGPHLLLKPFDPQTARAVVAGRLDGVPAAPGWPQEGTVNGLRMAAEQGQPAGWMVVLDGRVIGDCGTHGPPDENGEVEIGYGLAAGFRGHGYGTELVAAMTAWLLGRPGVTAVTARTEVDNVASRRVLEKNGFTLTGHDEEGLAVYRRGAAPARWRV